MRTTLIVSSASLLSTALLLLDLTSPVQSLSGRANIIQQRLKRHANADTTGHQDPVYSSQNPQSLSSYMNTVGALPVCSTADTFNYNPIKAPVANLFGNFYSTDQTDAVASWLLSQSTLNLTAFENATISDNYIWLVEALPVTKDAAIAYLDSDNQKNAVVPDLFAKVVVYGGGLKVPAVVEYKVGPLPVSDKTKYEVYNPTGAAGNGTIPYNSRYCDSIEYGALAGLFGDVMAVLAPFTQEVMGGVFFNQDNDTLIYSDSSPRSFDGTFRQTWFWWMKSVYGYYLAPVGLNMLVDHSGSDVSQWKVLKLVYANQVYNSAEDLMKDYNSKKLKVTKLSQDTEWASRDTKGGSRRHDDRTPPRVTSVDKPRVSFDIQEKYVKWMGWEFYIGSTRDTGVTIWDIRFKGNRVVYELGLQDALATYSGNDPVQASTSYLDRSWGIGGSLYQLLAGYDCPANSIKLNITTYVESSATQGNAICVYEAPSDVPISRHYDHGITPKTAFYGTTKGQVLTVRSIDGTIEVRSAASGYLQAGFWQKDGSQKAYGTRIQDTTMGSVHTHAMNYKVDIDILGTKNSLLDTSIEVVSEQLPWFDEPIVQKKISRSIVKDETASAFPIASTDPKTPHIYSIVNTEKENRWGYPRGYRIIPYSNPQYLHLTSDNKRAKSNANWAKYAMAITKRKETEGSSSSTYNQNLPTAPIVDFDKFIDGESIDKEDLVLWITIGMHHVPRAEDVPNTLTTSSRSVFLITPFNYHNDDGIRDIRQTALLVPGDNGPIFLNSTSPESCLGAAQSNQPAYDGF
ncbi:hypothetical protein HDU76_002082 [Blyttiomyces sp. JEL0837]|nr:hypothetical protein HDU76_002082 [Blyttiomyces sp. JEL0837]